MESKASPDGAPHAGETDVMVELNLDLRKPADLLSLGRVRELKEWDVVGGTAHLGGSAPQIRAFGGDGDRWPVAVPASFAAAPMPAPVPLRWSEPLSVAVSAPVAMSVPGEMSAPGEEPVPVPATVSAAASVSVPAPVHFPEQSSESVSEPTPLPVPFPAMVSVPVHDHPSLPAAALKVPSPRSATRSAGPKRIRGLASADTSYGAYPAAGSVYGPMAGSTAGSSTTTTAAAPAPGRCRALLAAGAVVAAESFTGARQVPVSQIPVNQISVNHVPANRAPGNGLAAEADDPLTAIAVEDLIRAVLIRTVADPCGRDGRPHDGAVAAVCSFALVLDLDRRKVRTGIGSSGPAPLAARAAERFLSGALDWTRLTVPPHAAQRFADLVADAAGPIDDTRGATAYQRRALALLATRALRWMRTAGAAGRDREPLAA